MHYDVRTDQASARPLAAIRAVTTQAKLASDIIRLLNIVWPVLRDQSEVQTGHNVVIYYGGAGDVLTVDVGVEVSGAFVPSGDVQLTPTEYSLLKVFVVHANRLLTHRQLVREVWGGAHYDDARHLLRVNISNLRRKLEADAARPSLITTEPGVGYRLRAEPASKAAEA